MYKFNSEQCIHLLILQIEIKLHIVYMDMLRRYEIVIYKKKNFQVILKNTERFKEI